MSVENLLSRLSKVRRRGGGQWMASCPCHEDKTPSLSIKDDNGTILLHCFSQQCPPSDICDSIGFDIVDLFPPSDNYDASQPRQKRQFYDAAQVLEGLAFEILVVQIISKYMLNNGKITLDERERLVKAISRIDAALEYTKRIMM